MRTFRKGDLRYLLFFFLLLFLLISPGLVFLYLEQEPIDVVVCFVAGLAAFSIPVVLFSRRLRLYFYLISIVAIFAPFAWIPPVIFGLGLNTDILTLTLNTNFQEAYELFGTMIWPFLLFFLIYVISYFYLVRKVPKKISFKSGLAVSIIGVILLLTVTLIRKGTTNYYRDTKAMVFDHYPFDFLYSVVKYSDKLIRIDHKELVKNFKFNAVKKDSLHQRQIYVLVIGETARYHNWGLNGYSRNTSPRLSARTDMLNFKHAATAGCMTELSVPLIITRASAADYDLHYKEKSVSAAFSEAGFFSYWITNQGNYFNVEMHSEESDSVISLVNSYSSQFDVKDIDVVNRLDKMLQMDTTSNLFIVLHTMGSHFSYNKRYPPEYNVFRPSGGEESINPTKASNKPILVNAYDNSILYTDMILDSMMTILGKQQAVSYLLYLSDHGENLYDDKRQLFLHPPSKPSKYVAHIPFFIWTSPEYDSVYPDKLRTLKSHTERPISSDDVFESLLDMANISYAKSDSTHSLSSPGFRDSKQEILGGNTQLYYFKNLK